MPQEPPAWNWARRWFGNDAAELRRKIPEALLSAHDLARSAHEAGVMETRDVYGTCLHVKQYEELARLIAGIDGSRVTKLGRHRVAILKDAVFYPWRYSVDGLTPIEEARLRRPVSTQRERLFHAHGPEPLQPALAPSMEKPIAEELLEAFPDLGEATRLIIAAFASSVDGGVLRAYWGEGELREDGLVVWHNREEFALPGDGFGFGSGGVSPIHPVKPLPKTGGGQRFDEGDMPAIAFPTRPRPVRETGSEVEPESTRANSDEED